jgi:lipopolysaccharide transport system permease protein
MVHPAISSKEKEEVIILKPTRGWAALNLGELWLYRELIYFMTWRDLKVRYKQTVLGAAWAILQPFLSMVVFSVFFGRWLGVPSGDVPYPVFSYTALLPWGLFSKAIADAGRSLVTNRAMITKVYFPRLTIPLASVLAGIVDFLIAFVVLLGMMWYYDIELTSKVLTLPFFLLLALIASLGVGLWLSAMNVFYRDIGYIIPFLTQIWFYLSPIVYATSTVPEKLQPIYALNPMVGVIDGFRWALLGQEPAPGPLLIISSAVAVILLVSGVIYFRRVERTFADMV